MNESHHRTFRFVWVKVGGKVDVSDVRFSAEYKLQEKIKTGTSTVYISSTTHYIDLVNLYCKEFKNCVMTLSDCRE